MYLVMKLRICLENMFISRFWLNVLDFQWHVVSSRDRVYSCSSCYCMLLGLNVRTMLVPCFVRTSLTVYTFPSRYSGKQGVTWFLWYQSQVKVNPVAWV